jgi:hypothetical protein
MMEAVRTSETSVCSKQTTRHNISESSHLHTRSDENLTFLFLCFSKVSSWFSVFKHGVLERLDEDAGGLLRQVFQPRRLLCQQITFFLCCLPLPVESCVILNAERLPFEVTFRTTNVTERVNANNDFHRLYQELCQFLIAAFI